MCQVHNNPESCSHCLPEQMHLKLLAIGSYCHHVRSSYYSGPPVSNRIRMEKRRKVELGPLVWCLSSTPGDIPEELESLHFTFEAGNLETAPSTAIDLTNASVFGTMSHF